MSRTIPGSSLLFLLAFGQNALADESSNFDADSARVALKAVEYDSCRQAGSTTGNANIEITFSGADGSVSAVAFATEPTVRFSTETQSCIVQKFQRVQIKRFSGSKTITWKVVLDAPVVLDEGSGNQCHKDTDCKGDRLCEKGQCVESRQAQPPTHADDSHRWTDSGELVRVTLTSDNPHTTLRRLETQVNETIGAEPDGVIVCGMPCNATVPRYSKYVVGGDGIWASGPFPLPPDRREIKLRVDAQSSTKNVLAMVLAIAGGSVAGVGLMGTGASLALGSDGKGFLVPSVVSLAGGTAVLVTGMILFKRTHVWIDDGTMIARETRPAFRVTPQGLAF